MSALSVNIGNDTEVFYTEIHAALQAYIEDRHIEDMKTEGQNIWSAALRYIQITVFKGTNKLKKEPYEVGKLLSGNKSNNNAYDINKLLDVCEYYITLCFEYDKEVSINGFCYLTGISKDIILKWGGKEGKYSSYIQEVGQPGVDLYKNLTENNEESLSGMLISAGGQRSPAAILGALNRRHGWNMGQPMLAEKSSTPALSQSEIQAYIEQAGQGESVDDLISELPDE